MNGMRKFLGFLMAALVLGAFALPASAATKFITLTVPAGPLAAGQQQIQVTIANGGNSNANSFEVDWIPSANFTVQSGCIGTSPCVLGSSVFGTMITPGAFKSPYLGIVWNQQVPLKTNVTVTLNVTVASGCGPTQVPFQAAAWTGSPGPLSTSFPMNPLGPVYTNIAAAPAGTCTLGFVRQPAGALVNTNITSVGSNPTGLPVQVALFSGAVIDTTFTGPITLGITPNTGTANAALSGGGPVNAVAGVATFGPSPALSISLAGSNYQLRASSSGLTPVDSTPFGIFNGVLNCGDFASQGGRTDLDPNLDGPFVGTPGWGLRRGPNTDGSACTLVDFTCDLTLSNIASCSYDKTTGQQASFTYVFLWNPVPPIALTDPPNPNPGAGWTNYRSQISWGIANPNPDTTSVDWVPGLACVIDMFPPLSPIPTHAQMLAVLPIIPNVQPFITNGAAHSQYLPGASALVCIGQQGSTSVGNPSTGNVLIQYYDKVLDEVDLLMKGPG